MQDAIGIGSRLIDAAVNGEAGGVELVFTAAARWRGMPDRAFIKQEVRVETRRPILSLREPALGDAAGNREGGTEDITHIIAHYLAHQMAGGASV